MTDFFHNVPVNAAPEKVYAAIATQAGMQGWWTRDTTMTAKVGCKAEFGFDYRGMAIRMTVDGRKPNRSLRLRCSGDHPEGASNTLELRVEPTPDVSVLKFIHRGWRETTDF